MRALAEAGVVGLRLNLIGRPDPDFGTPVWQGHLARAKDLGWQIEVQAEARRLGRLLPPLIAAGVPVVVDHFGRIDPALGIADPGFAQLLGFGAGGGVWVKLSGAYRIGSGEAGRQTARAAAERLRASFGARRLLWGSDWPHTQFETQASPAEALRDLEAWVPDAAERRIILGDTPAKLFPLRPVAPSGPEPPGSRRGQNHGSDDHVPRGSRRHLREPDDAQGRAPPDPLPRAVLLHRLRRPGECRLRALTMNRDLGLSAESNFRRVGAPSVVSDGSDAVKTKRVRARIPHIRGGERGANAMDLLISGATTASCWPLRAQERCRRWPTPSSPR